MLVPPKLGSVPRKNSMQLSLEFFYDLSLVMKTGLKPDRIVQSDNVLVIVLLTEYIHIYRDFWGFLFFLFFYFLLLWMIDCMHLLYFS